MTKAHNTGNLEISIRYASLPSVFTEAKRFAAAVSDLPTLSPATLDVIEEDCLIDTCDATAALEVMEREREEERRNEAAASQAAATITEPA